MRLALTVVSPAPAAGRRAAGGRPGDTGGGDRRSWSASCTAAHWPRGPGPGAGPGTPAAPQPRARAATCWPSPGRDPRAAGPLYVDQLLVPRSVAGRVADQGRAAWSASADPRAACGPSRPAWSRSGWSAARRRLGAPAQPRRGRHRQRPAATAIRIADPRAPAPRCRIGSTPRGRCQVAPYEGVRADAGPRAAHRPPRSGGRASRSPSAARCSAWRPTSRRTRPCTRRRTAAGIDFNRPPRLLPPERVTRFQLPAPPPAAERRPLPILMAVVPLVMGVAMAYFLHQVYLLAMARPEPGHADRQLS